MPAYAVKLIPDNFTAVHSEKPGFDQSFLEAWLLEHEEGYFIRDPGEVWDCEYLDSIVFDQIYKFLYKDDGLIFREIAKR